MRLLNNKVAKFFTLIVILFGAVLFGKTDDTYAAGGSPDYVIVLDPGHDSTHTGAHQNGYKEESINLKIAQYCKMELEKTPGIKVHLIRNSESCPYGGSAVGGSSSCNSQRIQYAKKVNADYYVSFHIDSSSSSSARGASVYYPNNNYRPEIGFKGERLAVEILSQLKAVGVSQRGRGIMIRNSENGSTYPDGSLADYLAVIKGNKKNNIPAVLIEHCFLSNKSDCNQFLSSDGKLQMLGKADSLGILNQLGLNNVSVNKAQDGNWYLYRNGNIDYGYTGLGANVNGWWYIRNGKVDFGANTLVKFKNSYWYVKNGKYDSTYTGVIRNQNGDWFVRNGEVDFSYTGVAEIHSKYNYNGNLLEYDGWYNFKNGQLIYANDVAKNNYGWWYVQNGKVNFNVNSVVKNNLGWWYVRDGKVDFGFTGIARNVNGDWYIQNGKVCFEKTGLIKVANINQKIDYATGETIEFDGTYYVENGKVIHNATTVAKDENGWWYIKDGVIQNKANTIVKNMNGWWYVKDGKVDFSFNGIARNENGDWYVKGGKVQLEETGLVKTDYKIQNYPDTYSEAIEFEGWYHVKNGKVQYVQDIVKNSLGWWYVGTDGKVDFSYCGIASNNYGTWYIENGKVNFDYNSDEYQYDDKVYKIENGKATEIVLTNVYTIQEDEEPASQTDEEMSIQTESNLENSLVYEK